MSYRIRRHPLVSNDLEIIVQMIAGYAGADLVAWRQCRRYCWAEGYAECVDHRHKALERTFTITEKRTGYPLDPRIRVLRIKANFEGILFEILFLVGQCIQQIGAQTIVRVR